MHLSPLVGGRPRALASVCLLAALSLPASAATLTFGTSAPTGGAASISNWIGAAFDADNVGGSGVNANGSPNNGGANDGTTYVAGDRPAQGQTFTTGSHPGGYTLSAITVRMQGYTNNTASGGNIGGYDLNDTSSTFRLRVGRLGGATFIPLTQETAAAGGSGNPGQGAAANGPGTYLTFTLKAPIVLAPGTTYAFDLGTGGDYFEWLGIRDATTGGNPYASGTAYTSGANGVAAGSITTQAGERVFHVDLAPHTPPAPDVFVHPGLLNTEADFDFIRTKVALGEEPWASGYAALDASWMSAGGGVNSRAQPVITRGATNDTVRLYQDIAVIYASALRWKISGDTAYADQAVKLINDWSHTLTAVQGDTNVALTELYAAEFACAAEIMRNYSGWAAADIAQCQTMLYNVFYPLANSFLTGHFGTAHEHYWANWDFASISAIYAIGVFCDNPALTDQALSYLHGGVGNGCIERFVNFIHPGHLGQSQEMGRDQGHATLDIAQVAAICEMAWNQGVDLYGYQNNRILAAAEYVAKYNLGEEVPFTPYASKDWLMTVPGSGSRGANNARPGWHTLYHHYVNHKGLAAPYTKTMADNMGHGWYYNGDSLGWDSLTAALPPIASGANPSGLTATVTAGQPVLSWWGSAHATGYNVKRASTAGGAYTTLATGLTTNTYTDAAVTPGTTYHYVVTATTPSGETGNSNETSALVGTALHARLKFDETSGATAADSTGNGWNGTLVNSPAWTTGTLGNAIGLAKTSDQSVGLPAGIASDLSDFSISAWVYQNSATTFARIFDFGTGGDFWGGINVWGGEIWRSERYLYLAPQAGGGKLRFGLSRSAGVGEQSVEGSAALPTGQWTHVTVTKSGPLSRLHVNGQLVGENAAMSLSPHQLPATPFNHIGKSQWRGDPYFDGLIDDFRIYRGALASADTQTLANRGVAHLKFDELAGTTARDATANGWNGTLVNGPLWNTGTLANAVDLDGANDHVALPAGIVSGLSTATISAWVNLDAIATWARVFDFGTGTNNYMFLAPRGGSNVIRFAIRTPSVGEQQINGTAALPAGGWHHVALTLNGSVGTLYVNGQQVGQNTGMTLNPSSLGATTQNYIGKSQWNDPYLNGRVDDFRIFGTALDAGQISVLASGLPDAAVTIVPGDSTNVLNWSPVAHATGYVIRRATTSGGPYAFLAHTTGTTFADTGLTNGVAYHYVVIAQSSLAQSPGATQGSGTPLTPAPAWLTANGWDAHVELSWAAVGGATYNIKRTTGSGGPYTTVASGLATADYTDTGLANGTTYHYVVTALKGSDESDHSAEVSATPFTDPVVRTWSQQDVNSTGIAGNASYAGGTYTVSGAGADIWGTNDAFHFVRQTLAGDGAIIARVASQTHTNAWAKAGVMLREASTSYSPHAATLITPVNGAAFIYRTSSGGASASANLAGPLAPYWVKTARNGDTFTGYVSADGDVWTTLGSQTIAMGASIQAGLAVTSHDTAQLSTAVFDQVAIVPSADWSSEDIGGVGAVGGSFYSGGVASVVGAGADIWGTADAFRYTYRLASGDCDITARVTAIDNTNVWAKAGVMIRETLTAGSRHAMAVVTPGSGVSFQRRTTTDGTSAHTTTGGLAAPYWVRVTRVGNLFTAYRSADGVTWTTIGSATIPMASDVAIGLAVTSHSAGALCSATLDNITVTP